MKICPQAKLDNGSLDLVVIGDLSSLDVLVNVYKIYGGTHLSLEDVSNSTLRRLEATPVEADAVVPIELDGETPGRLPATFEVLPGALRVRF